MTTLNDINLLLGQIADLARKSETRVIELTAENEKLAARVAELEDRLDPYDLPLPAPTRIVTDGETLKAVADYERVYLMPGATVKLAATLHMGANSTLFSDRHNPATLVMTTGTSGFVTSIRMKKHGARVHGIRFDHANGHTVKATCVGVNADNCRVEYCDWTDRITRFVVSEGTPYPKGLLVLRNQSEALLGGARKSGDDAYFAWLGPYSHSWRLVDNEASVLVGFTVRCHYADGDCLIESNTFSSDPLVEGTITDRNVTIRSTTATGTVTFTDNTLYGGSYEVGYDTSNETYHKITTQGNEFNGLKFIDVVGSPNGSFSFTYNHINGGVTGAAIDVKPSYGTGVAPSGVVANNTVMAPAVTRLLSKTYASVDVKGNTLHGAPVAA